jgi:hypothetical protein
LIDRLREKVATDPDALLTFNASLAFAGWTEHPSHGDVAVRTVSINRHVVGPDFPRLTRGTVPTGVQEADYTIVVPTVM